MLRVGKAASRALALVVPLLLTSSALAEDSELRLMGEPASFTDVIDALDKGDPFDLNVHVGFRRLRHAGTIQREETASGDAAAGRASNAFVDIADWEHVRNVLDLGLDIGIYHDLALYTRLPVVLSDTRDLSLPSPGANVGEDLRAVRGNAMSEPLFDVPFDSPTRSGLDYLSVGLAWGIFNQHRTPDVPTWILMLEGRFNVSEEMHACRNGAAGRECLQETSTGTLEVLPGGSTGVGRGTNGLRIETRTSKRYRYLEPYMGVAFQMEWPGKADDFFAPAGNLDGFMNTLPPRVGELTAGMAIVPWENRGKWQRFSIDLRIIGTYISEGREYSPLFDPLGSSSSPHLSEPNQEGIPDGVTSLRDVEFTGLTDVQSHGRIGGRLAIEMQAAQYIWFGFGAGVFYDTPYLISFADACNPDVEPAGNEDARRGRCREGIINPHHRPAIDLPGSRFRLDGALTLDIFATAVAQF